MSDKKSKPEPTVFIQVNTGFSNAKHVWDTGLTKKEWEKLSDEDKSSEYNTAISENIDCNPILCDQYGEKTGIAVQS